MQENMVCLLVFVKHKSSDLAARAETEFRKALFQGLSNRFSCHSSFLKGLLFGINI